MTARPALALVALLALAGCQASGELGLTYVAAGAPPVAAPRPVVAVGAVTDARRDGQAGTGQYGTIRGGYGNPLSRLTAPTPVSQEVAGVLRSALTARGLLAGGTGAARELRIRVVELNASKLLRTEATVRLEGTLVNPATGASVWTGEGAANIVEAGSFFATGIAADPQELRGTMLRALSRATDAMLDRPDFAAALR